jgi:hypothetical protein
MGPNKAKSKVDVAQINSKTHLDNKIAKKINIKDI